MAPKKGVPGARRDYQIALGEGLPNPIFDPVCINGLCVSFFFVRVCACAQFNYNLLQHVQSSKPRMATNSSLESASSFASKFSSAPGTDGRSAKLSFHPTRASAALSSAPMSAATRTILRRASSRVATLNSSGVGEVRVDLRSGRIAAPPPPPLQFEGLAKKAMQYAPMTIEESLFIIEQSLANGQLKATEAVMTGVRLLRKQVAREEELLLREALHA